ncbi:CUB and zona pellucida-like domain-containing protein 1 [Halichoeres trimaculatus]|uniref:CUB and zona pellucida-like domain-containing protein 1 n=1 Tax=Halichoeres trimaculatus TaxID=147232 RepID=UPI003D9E5602
MASTLVLLLQLLLVSLASASRHMGGSATVTYRGQSSNGTFMVDFRYRNTFDRCQYGHFWSCIRECLSHTNQDKQLLLDLHTKRSHQLEASDFSGFRKQIRHQRTKQITGHCYYSFPSDSCTLQYNQGTYNSRIYAFELVVEDSPKHPITLAYSDGSLAFKAPAMKRRKRQMPPNWSATTATTTTTTPASSPPLSKLPLHFSLLVDQYVISCTAGKFLPKYLYPTPENGARIQAEVNKEVEIRVKAKASFSMFQKVIYSGPQGITKTKISNKEFAIKWTPGPNDVGQHYVVCFVVESVFRFKTYQSDMRCVIVDVRHRIANVICSQSEMRVEVDKSTFPRLSEDHLRLSDPSNVVCSLKTHSNSSHIIAVFPLNACGNQIEEDSDYLKFKNEITTFDNSSDVITRTHQLEVQFYCQYPKRGNVTQNFLAHRNLTTVWEKGIGRFTYRFEFFPNATFQTMIDPKSYPLEYEVGTLIFMEIEATSPVNNTELFVESCRASPYDNPNSKPVYEIIQNGCNVDPTFQIHYINHPMQFRFSVNTFKFIGLHDQVYITCSVLVCRAGDPDTRCSQGCITSTTPSNALRGRQKRAVGTQSSLHHISQGPLCAPREKRSLSPGKKAGINNMNLNVIFIAGCLLAAVGMISGATVYIVKISKMKYQPLTTQES